MQKEQFIEAIKSEQESLRRFLLVLCNGNDATADDIAQETLLKAYLSFERFEGRAQFSTWLFRIAYNCFYDHVNRAKPVADNSLETIANSEADTNFAADRQFEHEQLHLALANLSEAERNITLLFYMEEKSIKEIAEITSMPSGTVRSHLSRARNHLKEFLSTKII